MGEDIRKEVDKIMDYEEFKERVIVLSDKLGITSDLKDRYKNDIVFRGLVGFLYNLTIDKTLPNSINDIKDAIKCVEFLEKIGWENYKQP